MTMRRTQIYLTEDEDRTLEKESRRTGRSKAALIRDAVDRVFGVEDRAGRKRLLAAIAATSGAWADLSDEEFGRLRRLRKGWGPQGRGRRPN